MTEAHLQDIVQSPHIDELTVFQQAFEHLPFSVGVYEGPEHRLLYLNPMAEQDWPEATRGIGLPARDFLPAEWEWVIKNGDHVFRTGEAVQINAARLIGAAEFGGVEKFANVFFSPRWRDGKVVGVINTVVNITESFRTERVFRRIVEDNPVGIIVVAFIGPNKGKLSLVNDAYLNLIGYTRQEFQAGHVRWDQITPPDFYAADEAAIAETLQHGKVKPYDKELIHRDGHRIPVMVAPAWIPGTDEILSFVLDVADRKRAEEEVRQMNQVLEQRVALRTADLVASNQELDSFAYSVSHDLRAPLRHLEGYSALLKKNHYTQLDEHGQRYLNKIAVSAHKMDRLVDDLLAFSRLGRAELSRTPVPLQPLLEEVRRDLEPDTDGRNVVWLIGELPEVYGDRALLRQVFFNLLSNAVKYTRHQSEARIEIGCLASPTDHTTIFVRDNGVGFDMQYAAKLFNVFQRLHSDEFEGVGVGLANVRRIVERHGGRAWAESVLDQGATFYFSLPNTPLLQTHANA